MGVEYSASVKPLAAVNGPLLALILLARSARQRSRLARLLAASLAIAAYTASQPPSADGIRDFPVHPILRNLIGRLAVPFMDTLTTVAHFLLKQYPVKAQAPLPVSSSGVHSSLVTELQPRLLEEVQQKGRTGRIYDPSQLYDLFDHLPPARSSEMVGKHYSAIVFRGGGILEFASVTCAPLLKAGYALGLDFGKRYENNFSGYPLGWYFGNLWIPFLLWGNVTMLNVEHRGRPEVATMIYDTHPYKDAFVHLGKVDGKDVLLGTWEVHGTAGGFFFLKEK